MALIRGSEWMVVEESKENSSKCIAVYYGIGYHDKKLQ